jgi:hypothetical protein
MERHIRWRTWAGTLTLLVGACAALGQNRTSSGVPAVDRPSNGVLVLSAEPIESFHRLGRGAPPPLEDGRQPWEGALTIHLTNITRRTVTLDVYSPQWSFAYEMLDSAGRLVLATPLGGEVAATRTGRLMLGFLGGSTLHLAPLESADAWVDLAKLFQIKLGYAYTIKIKRVLDAATTDEAGKPLAPDQRELSTTVYIQGKNADR